MIRCFYSTAALALMIAPVSAQEFKAGDITIVQPWSRATPKGSPVGAGYLVIRNTGATADRLVGGSSDAARDVQVHEMTMDGGVMKMRQLANGLEIPAGGSVELKPGGYHLMLLNLSKQLARGEALKITLTFARAGAVPVEFRIGGIGDAGPEKAGDGMKMDHGGMHANH